MSEFGAWAAQYKPKDDTKTVFHGRKGKPVVADPYLSRANICPKCMMPKATLTGACFCF